jgi:hypothetical protein
MLETPALKWRNMSFGKDLEVQVESRADLGLNAALVRRYMVETKVIPFAPHKELQKVKEIRADWRDRSAFL